MAPLKILVPLDGTDFSQHIVPHLEQLFRPEDVRVHLLHVATPPAPAAPTYQPAAWGPDTGFYAYRIDSAQAAQSSSDDLFRTQINEAYDHYRASLEGELRAEVEQLGEAGFDAEVTVHFGEPAQDIIDFALAEGVDVIAMMTRGRQGLGRLFQGSVTETVLRRVDVPVVLVRGEEGGE